ncbi:tripartite ATP-independent transporter DctP family solute receptor [Desulfofundulus luciae]|uniref:Tripartite ATP-independent transporter DctP family solute receptor n=1 Tax=Desulfofundulus luciae TaxID=74702 RepID=A0ABU0B426_9FIRM|nr:TRAP transporter substrate-binding protein [Desulfofundulus luciae]MDQ0287020.1 tripartite ATP-independent transporter DctP family solute receptor [Desulfofundulus luciae]
MRKKLIAMITVTFLVVAAVLAGCGQQPKQEKTGTGQEKPKLEFKVGHVTQATHPYHLSVEAFAKKVDEKSNGRIKITIYPARQLGDDKQLLEGVIAGTQDMALVSASMFAAYTPVLAGLQLPWLITDYDTEQKVLQSDVVRRMLDTLETHNMKGLAIYEGGLRDMLFAKKKPTVPSDVSGMKFRVPPSEVIKDWAQAIGVNPVPLPYGEIYNALQTGMVDGMEMNPSSVYSEKLFEVSKYLLDSNQFPFPCVLVMNLNKWKSLSAEDQKIIQDAAWEAIADSIKINKEKEGKDLDFIKSHGVTVYAVDMTPWKAKVKPVYDKWMAKDPLIKELVEKVRENKI